MIPDDELDPATRGRKDDRYQYNFLSEATAKTYRTQRPPWANSTYDVFKETMQPLLAFIGGPATEFTAKDHAFYSGESVEKSAVLVWDGPGVLDGKLKWRLEMGDRENRRYQKGTDPFCRAAGHGKDERNAFPGSLQRGGHRAEGYDGIHLLAEGG